MKIAIGSDHGGFELKEKVINFLTINGYEVLDLGCDSMDSVDYPKYGRLVGEAVVEKKADKGIVICGTGIGISIAANKVKGVRAALCTNTTMAKLTREHNDANVLSMGARMVGDILALEMVDVFLTTKFEGGRHQKRIDQLEG
ncbi:ribose 5-phosphate isomerase B [Psychrilyobacter sp.]|uniref:ribose 5-phosphate isomerase B n=1 Tax=Psychrilyobacter sp. TaxID=2586924 RepID=UPI0030169528